MAHYYMHVAPPVVPHAQSHAHVASYQAVHHSEASPQSGISPHPMRLVYSPPVTSPVPASLMVPSHSCIHQLPYGHSMYPMHVPETPLLAQPITNNSTKCIMQPQPPGRPAHRALTKRRPTEFVCSARVPPCDNVSNWPHSPQVSQNCYGSVDWLSVSGPSRDPDDTLESSDPRQQHLVENNSGPVVYTSHSVRSTVAYIDGQMPTSSFWRSKVPDSIDSDLAVESPVMSLYGVTNMKVPCNQQPLASSPPVRRTSSGLSPEAPVFHPAALKTEETPDTYLMQDDGSFRLPDVHLVQDMSSSFIMPACETTEISGSEVTDNVTTIDTFSPSMTTVVCTAEDSCSTTTSDVGDLNVDHIVHKLWRKFASLFNIYGPMELTDEQILNLFIKQPANCRRIMMSYGSIREFLLTSNYFEMDGTKMALRKRRTLDVGSDGGDVVFAVSTTGGNTEKSDLCMAVLNTDCGTRMEQDYDCLSPCCKYSGNTSYESNFSDAEPWFTNTISQDLSTLCEPVSSSDVTSSLTTLTYSDPGLAHACMHHVIQLDTLPREPVCEREMPGDMLVATDKITEIKNSFTSAYVSCSSESYHPELSSHNLATFDYLAVTLDNECQPTFNLIWEYFDEVLDIVNEYDHLGRTVRNLAEDVISQAKDEIEGEFVDSLETTTGSKSKEMTYKLIYWCQTCDQPAEEHGCNMSLLMKWRHKLSKDIGGFSPAHHSPLVTTLNANSPVFIAHNLDRSVSSAAINSLTAAAGDSGVCLPDGDSEMTSSILSIDADSMALSTVETPVVSPSSFIRTQTDSALQMPIKQIHSDSLCKEVMNKTMDRLCPVYQEMAVPVHTVPGSDVGIMGASLSETEADACIVSPARIQKCDVGLMTDLPVVSSRDIGLMTDGQREKCDIGLMAKLEDTSLLDTGVMTDDLSVMDIGVNTDGVLVCDAGIMVDIGSHVSDVGTRVSVADGFVPKKTFNELQQTATSAEVTVLELQAAVCLDQLINQLNDVIADVGKRCVSNGDVHRQALMSIERKMETIRKLVESNKRALEDGIQLADLPAVPMADCGYTQDIFISSIPTETETKMSLSASFSSSGPSYRLAETETKTSLNVLSKTKVPDRLTETESKTSPSALSSSNVPDRLTETESKTSPIALSSSNVPDRLTETESKTSPSALSSSNVPDRLTETESKTSPSALSSSNVPDRLTETESKTSPSALSSSNVPDRLTETESKTSPSALSSSNVPDRLTETESKTSPSALSSSNVPDRLTETESKTSPSALSSSNVPDRLTETESKTSPSALSSSNVPDRLTETESKTSPSALSSSNVPDRLTVTEGMMSLAASSKCNGPDRLTDTEGKTSLRALSSSSGPTDRLTETGSKMSLSASSNYSRPLDKPFQVAVTRAAVNDASVIKSALPRKAITNTNVNSAPVHDPSVTATVCPQSVCGPVLTSSPIVAPSSPSPAMNIAMNSIPSYMTSPPIFTSHAKPDVYPGPAPISISAHSSPMVIPVSSLGVSLPIASLNSFSASSTVSPSGFIHLSSSPAPVPSSVVTPSNSTYLPPLPIPLPSAVVTKASSTHMPPSLIPLPSSVVTPFSSTHLSPSLIPLPSSVVTPFSSTHLSPSLIPLPSSVVTPASSTRLPPSHILLPSSVVTRGSSTRLPPSPIPLPSAVANPISSTLLPPLPIPLPSSVVSPIISTCTSPLPTPLPSSVVTPYSSTHLPRSLIPLPSSVVTPSSSTLLPPSSIPLPSSVVNPTSSIHLSPSLIPVVSPITSTGSTHWPYSPMVSSVPPSSLTNLDANTVMRQMAQLYPSLASNPVLLQMAVYQHVMAMQQYQLMSSGNSRNPVLPANRLIQVSPSQSVFTGITPAAPPVSVARSALSGLVNSTHISRPSGLTAVNATPATICLSAVNLTRTKPILSTISHTSTGSNVFQINSTSVPASAPGFETISKLGEESVDVPSSNLAFPHDTRGAQTSTVFTPAALYKLSSHQEIEAVLKAGVNKTVKKSSLGQTGEVLHGSSENEFVASTDSDVQSNNNNCGSKSSCHSGSSFNLKSVQSAACDILIGSKDRSSRRDKKASFLKQAEKKHQQAPQPTIGLSFNTEPVQTASLSKKVMVDDMRKGQEVELDCVSGRDKDVMTLSGGYGNKPGKPFPRRLGDIDILPKPAKNDLDADVAINLRDSVLEMTLKTSHDELDNVDEESHLEWQQVGVKKKKGIKSEPKQTPKSSSFEKLVTRMMEQFPDFTRADVIHVITRIRTSHGSLNGLPLHKIVEEAVTVVQSMRQSTMTSLTKHSPNDLTFKSLLCNSFMSRGFCSKGSSCTFAHGSKELNPLLKTQLCSRFMSKVGCTYGPKCCYAHGYSELRTAPLPPSLSGTHTASGAQLVTTTKSANLPPVFAPVTTPVWNVQTSTKKVSPLPYVAKTVNRYTATDEEPDDCVVCFDSLKYGELKSLDCGHEFHLECIKRWVLGEERTCPTCRQHALFPEEFPKLGD